MPDASGNFKGAGWSRAREDAWERVFGDAATQCCGDLASGRPCAGCPAVLACSNDNKMCGLRGCVPREPPSEDQDAWRPEDYDQERSA